MPKNKDFFHRIYLLDECMRRRDKRWCIEDLLDDINQKLSLNYGKTISIRTLYDDLKYLKEEKDAPIEKSREGGKMRIRYSCDFSLKNIPLHDDELLLLKDAAAILRQVGGLSIVQDIDAVVAKLENAGAANTQQNIIQFESHTASAGWRFIDDIFSAIKGNSALEIIYRPFGKTEPYQWVVHPYLLKEYRNRWFLLGRLESEVMKVTVALDRLEGLKPSQATFIPNDLFDADTVFNNCIGVTLLEGGAVSDIVINVAAQQAPYVQTKPIHFSQEVVQRFDGGGLQIRLRLVVNYELRAVLLSYGADLEVMEPLALREQMKVAFSSGHQLYG